MTDNTCREAFEWWYVKYGGDVEQGDLRCNDSGRYIWGHTIMAYEAWQAAWNNRNNDKLLREALAFFDNKIYILERAPKDELSDRYRVEVTKLRGEITKIKAALGE